MLAREGPQWPKLRASMMARRRVAEGGREVAVLVQLVPVGPDTDRQHTSDDALPTNALHGPHPDVVQDLQTFVDHRVDGRVVSRSCKARR